MMFLSDQNSKLKCNNYFLTNHIISVEWTQNEITNTASSVTLTVSLSSVLVLNLQPWQRSKTI
jgi:hypothetical protein